MTITFHWTAQHTPTVRTRGHWFLRDKPRGQWYPEAIGIVPNYPTTREEWERRRAIGLKNLAGQSGATNMRYCKVRPKEVKRLRVEAQARTAAKMEKIVKKIAFEDDRAEKAMATAVEIMELKDANGKHLNDLRHVLVAAKLICDFTQPKPVTRNEHVVKAAEDWLSGLE